MAMMSELGGIVTGGGSGIGEATVQRLLSEGARVIAVDRDPLALDAMSKKFRGPNLTTLKVDVTDDAQVTTAISQCIEEFKRIDFLVNSAGVTLLPIPIYDLKTSEIDRMLEVNLKGTFLVMQKALVQMRKSGSGSIVNVASTAGIRPMGSVSPYVASKYGVVGLTMAAALECAPDGIRVNAVCPGVTATPMYFSSPKEYGDQAAKVTPLRRMAQPNEIANAIVWLLSAEASYVTGAALPVDGGLALI